MIFFGAPELRSGHDLRHDWPPGLQRQRLFRSLSNLLLLRVEIKDDVAILRTRTEVGSGISQRPELIQQLLIGDNVWIIFQFDCFGVTGQAAADSRVGGIVGEPASITDGRRLNSFDLLKPRLNAPESASGKHRLLESVISGT